MGTVWHTICTSCTKQQAYNTNGELNKKNYKQTFGQNYITFQKFIFVVAKFRANFRLICFRLVLVFIVTIFVLVLFSLPACFSFRFRLRERLIFVNSTYFLFSCR